MVDRLLKTALLLGIIVVILGAYTRLTNAGLGCPDWPTCYGGIIVPEQITPPENSTDSYAAWRIKAWTEMAHRYAASLLGLVILILSMLTLRQPKSLPINSFERKFILILLVLVVLQGLLGMLTVTELLHPLIVVLHLAGGMITVSCIFYLLKRCAARSATIFANNAKLKPWVWIALLVVGSQILLGGWTSANYAALSCGDFFPTCLGSWLPDGLNFTQALLPTLPLGVNYEYGVLETEQRIAIQLLHRFGALLVIITLIALALRLKAYKQLRNKALLILILLSAQISLGILNVVLSLPLTIAVLHNLFALLLLLSLINLLASLSLRA